MSRKIKSSESVFVAKNYSENVNLCRINHAEMFQGHLLRKTYFINNTFYVNICKKLNIPGTRVGPGSRNQTLTLKKQKKHL